MKKIFFTILLIGFIGSIQSQNLSKRAKADRLKQITHSHMNVRDVSIQFDTLVVVTLSEELFYPFGKYTSVNDFVQKSGIEWYRSSERHGFSDTLDITVYNFTRLDGSFINFFRSVKTGYLDFIDGSITDRTLKLVNGIHVGMRKQAILDKYFKNAPRAYTEDIKVLKIYSGLYEVAQTFSFDEEDIRAIGFSSDYVYY